MILSQAQNQFLMNRMPNFELSYETIPHKKVYPSYDVGLAIPSGKKYFAWFSFSRDQDVCYFMELNKDKKITKASICPVTFPSSFSLGTILYGTLIPYDPNETEINVITGKFFFIIEDIFYYRGVPLKNMLFSEKLGYLEKFMLNINHEMTDKNAVLFTLPFMWSLKSHAEESIMAEFEQQKDIIHYNTHHIQIRKLNEISPYFNIHLINALTKMNQRNKQTVVSTNSLKHIVAKLDTQGKFDIDFTKPQYKYPTVFQVQADLQNDVYHLYVYGKNKASLYYGIACIPDIKTSMFMNSIFRNIKENKNIDYIEESEDEEDFENIAEDKHVNLDKTISIECTFHFKFKKWVPLRVVSDMSKIVHISKLAN